MEFKFRAVDCNNNNNQPPPCFSSHQELMMSMMQRDRIEKVRIREELIAAEVERRRLKLEEEVRREFMMMEAWQADGGVGDFGSGSIWLAPANEGVMRQFNPRKAWCFHNQFDYRLWKDHVAFSAGGSGESLNQCSLMQQEMLQQPPLTFNDRLLKDRMVFSGGGDGSLNQCLKMQQTMLPQSPLTKPAFSFGSGNKKLIMLAEPETTSCGVKRKADEPPAEEANNEFSFSGKKKKPKEEWICDVCQIRVPSRGQLDTHRQGKKHKVKAARSRAGTTGKTERTASSSELNLDVASSGLKEWDDPEKHQVPIDGSGKKTDGEEVTEKKASSIELNLHNANSGLKKQGEGDNLYDLIGGLGDRANNKEVAKRTVFSTNLVDVDVGLGLKEQVIGGKLQDSNEGVVKMTGDKKEKYKSNEIVCSESKDAKNLNDIEVARIKTGKHANFVKKFKFWCKICQVGAPTEAVMESHLKGKKHLARLNGLAENSATNITLTAIPLLQGKEKVLESVPDESIGCVAATTTTSNTVLDEMEEGEFRVPTIALENVIDGKEKADDGNNGMPVLVQKIGVSEISNTVADTKQMEEKNLKSTTDKKLKSWCETCQLGSDSEVWMECHLKGSIHVRRLLELTAKALTHASETIEGSATDKITEHSFARKGEASPTTTSDATDNTASELKTKIEAKTSQVSADDFVNATSKKDGMENKNELAAKNLNSVQAEGEQTTLKTPAFTAKYKFWCEVCQTGTNMEAHMQNHVKGKKHLTRLCRKQTQNGTT